LGTFQLDKVADTSNMNIYRSGYVCDAKKLMAKILEDPDWQEAIGNLNNSIIKIFEKSKDLRIHQTANVTGNIQLIN